MKLFNTLTRKKQVFKPLRTGKVSFYACGPTVYSSPHIGHARMYLFEDVLRRTLEYTGYKVHHVMNVTDVGHLVGDGDLGEDKVESAAKKEGIKVSEITHKYFDEFKRDLKELNILMPNKFAWATKYIPQQKQLVERIYAKKYAYLTDDGIYFDTQKFGKYGKLGGLDKRKAEESQSRTGVDPDKKHPFDFALWKFSYSPRLQEWSSPLKIKQKGFPGWHLECSAISTAELGQPFDLHAGGIDHVTTHHNNEIAQSEAGFGKPLANYWVHGEHLLMKDSTHGQTKMSKSLGNVTSLSSLKDEGFDPLAFRYLTLTTHYRTRLVFSKTALQASQVALNKMREIVLEAKSSKQTNGKVILKYKTKFEKAISDDLNTAQGLAVAWEMLKSANSLADKFATLLDFDRVLGLGLEGYRGEKIPANILMMAKEREKARKDKDWARSDVIRDEIEKMGFRVKDTPSGYELSKI